MLVFGAPLDMCDDMATGTRRYQTFECMFASSFPLVSIWYEKKSVLNVREGGQSSNVARGKSQNGAHASSFLNTNTFISLKSETQTVHTPKFRPKRLLRGQHTAEWAESRQLELKCFRCGECEKWVVSTCDWTKFLAFMFTHTAVIEGLQLKIRLLCSASSATPQTAVWIYAMCAQRIAIQLRMRWWRIFSRFCLRFAVCVWQDITCAIWFAVNARIIFLEFANC